MRNNAKRLCHDRERKQRQCVDNKRWVCGRGINGNLVLEECEPGLVCQAEKLIDSIITGCNGWSSIEPGVKTPTIEEKIVIVGEGKE